MPNANNRYFFLLGKALPPLNTLLTALHTLQSVLHTTLLLSQINLYDFTYATDASTQLTVTLT